VVIALDGVDTVEGTAVFADQLLALMEQHSAPGAGSAVVSYQAAAAGFLAYWRVVTLPGLRELSRAPLDRAALPDPELSADQAAMLAGLRRESQERTQPGDVPDAGQRR